MVLSARHECSKSLTSNHSFCWTQFLLVHIFIMTVNAATVQSPSLALLVGLQARRDGGYVVQHHFQSLSICTPRCTRDASLFTANRSCSVLARRKSRILSSRVGQGGVIEHACGHSQMRSSCSDLEDGGYIVPCALETPLFLLGPAHCR
jgi:hypothetical protein